MVKTAWQRTFIIVWLDRATAADTEQYVDDDARVRCIIFESLIGTANEERKKRVSTFGDAADQRS